MQSRRSSNGRWLAAALLGTAVFAQDPVIRGGVELVDLLVTVRDKKGALVKGLDQSQFRVFEDGVAQTIRRFARETQLPLTVGMLVDVSGSVAEEIPEERRAARQFFEQILRPSDRAFVMAFGRSATLLQEPTDSLRTLEAALDDLAADQFGPPRLEQRFQFPGGPRLPPPFPGGGGRGGRVPRVPRAPVAMGGTVLYDAVYLAAEEVLKPLEGRKAILVISDGEDQGSKVRFSEAIEAVQRADAIVYTIYVKPDRRRADGEDVLGRMAAQTGGRAYRLEKRNLPKIFAEISDELREQYSLSYSPSNTARDGTFRRIDVRMANQNHRAQTREGYYAPRQP